MMTVNAVLASTCGVNPLVVGDSGVKRYRRHIHHIFTWYITSSHDYTTFTTSVVKPQTKPYPAPTHHLTVVESRIIGK